MKDQTITALCVIGVVSFFLFVLFGMQWVAVLINMNACAAMRAGGPAYHREAAWFCEGRMEK